MKEFCTQKPGNTDRLFPGFPYYLSDIAFRLQDLHVTERSEQSEQDHQGDDGDHYGIDEYREVSLLVSVLGVDHYRSDKSVLGQRVESQASQSCAASQSLVVD